MKGLFCVKFKCFPRKTIGDKEQSEFIAKLSLSGEVKIFKIFWRCLPRLTRAQHGTVFFLLARILPLVVQRTPQTLLFLFYATMSIKFFKTGHGCSCTRLDELPPRSAGDRRLFFALSRANRCPEERTPSCPIGMVPHMCPARVQFCISCHVMWVGIHRADRSLC